LKAASLAEKSMETHTNRTSERADVREYLRPLLRRWWLVAGIAIAVAAISYVHFNGKPPRYTASTNLLIQSASLNSVITGTNVGGDPERTANNQATLVQSEAVAEQVAKQMGFRGDPRALLGAVSVTPIDKTDFIQITATAGNARVAASIANEFAKAYKTINAAEAKREADTAVRAAREQMKKLTPNTRQYEQLADKIERLEVLRGLPSANVRQLDPAVPPAASEGPDPVRNAIFGFVVALLLGAGAAYALESLDRRIRRSTDIEPLYDCPALTELPHTREPVSSIDGKLALPRSLTEGFRGLRTSLQLKSSLEPRLGGEELRTILVASAIAGEGKSTIVRNLAIAYREAGVNVAVVDADLRKPTLSRMMVEDTVPGLLEVLTGAVELDEAIRQVDLHVEGLATISRVQQAMQDIQRPDPVPVAAAPAPAATEARPVPGGALRRLMGAAGHPHAAPSRPPSVAPAAMPARNGNGHGNGNGNGNGAGTLSLLTTGAAPADPGAVLASRRFQVLLNELAERHDVVLIDSSPLLPVSDALPLLSVVDGVVLTSRVGVTTRGAARQVVQTIRRVPGSHILGVVANDVRLSEGRRAYGYGYGYRHYGGYGSTSKSDRGD
jgi:Mrp family chromosome partitioning ATPase/capsular polysaccharide biosynthesis protein